MTGLRCCAAAEPSGNGTAALGRHSLGCPSLAEFVADRADFGGVPLLVAIHTILHLHGAKELDHRLLPDITVAC